MKFCSLREGKHYGICHHFPNEEPIWNAWFWSQPESLLWNQDTWVDFPKKKCISVLKNRAFHGTEYSDKTQPLHVKEILSNVKSWPLPSVPSATHTAHQTHRAADCVLCCALHAATQPNHTAPCRTSPEPGKLRPQPHTKPFKLQLPGESLSQHEIFTHTVRTNI